MKAALILLVVGATAVLGSPSDAPVHVFDLPGKIVGGSPATKGEFPWIVSLKIGSHICGGSIVNANWIVTAAHCSTYAANQYTVVAGEHHQTNNDGTEQSRSVSQIIRHPSYNANTYANDIALMKLSSPFTFNTAVKAANMPSSSTGISGNLVVSGWGTTSAGGSASATLLKVTVPHVPTTTCNQNYPGQILNGMVCAGMSGKDSCQGDSGGPLINSAKTLVGIVSWGYSCAAPGYPGVYTSVPYFISWINSNTY